MTLQALIQKFEAYADPEWQEKWDNCGWQVMPQQSDKKAKILVCLTPTLAVLEEAKAGGYDLVFAHHPMIFHSLKCIGVDDAPSQAIRYALKNDIGVYSAHTNLDQVEGGTADILADALGLVDKESMIPTGEARGYGRVGHLPNPMQPKAFLAFVAKALGCSSLDHGVIRRGEPLSRIAVLGGSGADFMAQAAAVGAQAYITADCKFHQFQEATDMGLLLVDTGHYASERPACGALVTRLRALGAEDVHLSNADEDFRMVSHF